ATADPADTARALSAGRAVLMIIEHFWIWYRKGWRSSVVSSVVQPVLFLFAFGMGFGSLVNAGGRLGSAGVDLGGVPYLAYLAPGLLAMSAVQIAAFESTYPVMSGFKWQQIYWGMAASPITPGQIAVGTLSWVVLRMFASGAVYLVVIVLVGGAVGPGLLVALFTATLCGAAFAAPTMAFAASMESEGSAFPTFFRFVLIPMTLFAGTFYPVSRLPEWARPIAWITPLWHGTELSRGVALGSLRLLPALGHLGYLTALLVIGIWLARRQFARRLRR
ncbi:MAG TPA: ABC transporter permease, partial [Pseudonocardia sp.]